MKSSPFSRRAFIKSAGIASGLALLEPPVSGQTIKDFIFRRRCRDAGAIIRKSFKTLTAAELTAFKKLTNLQRQRAISVTLVPSGLETRAGRRLPVRSDGRVSVEQVTLTVDEPQR